MTEQEFKLHISADQVDDLRQRLLSARFPAVFSPGPSRPDEDQASLPPPAREMSLAEDQEWYYGVSRRVLKDLVSEFEGEFLPKWEEVQAELNQRMPQFTMQISEGRTVHYCHQKAFSRSSPVQGISRKVPVPIVLLHGWPSTIYDFEHVVPLLAAQGFHVVVPSPMGFGFSKGKEASIRDHAALVVELMHALGYKHFIAQGGDWGAFIASFLAAFHSDSCVAIHSNMPLLNIGPEFSFVNANKFLRLAANYGLPSLTLDAREARAARRLVKIGRTGLAYFFQHVQSPDTIGHALQDSPVGLLAYIAEKFHYATWDFESSKRALFTTVAVLWFSKSVTSSIRFYRNAALSGDLSALPSFVNVPTGILCAPGEPLQYPRSLSELSFDVRRYTVLDRGGHFLPAEEPELLVQDVVDFVDESIDFDACVARGPWKGESMPLKKQLPYSAPFLPFIALGAAALWRSKL